MDGINIEKNFWRDDLDGRDVIVTIRCITYNHEKYIADALDGFVMQKTNFRFEAIIHDDASTDGTADIIRQYAERYPSIIKPIFEKENQYSKHDDSIDRTMIAHTRGKYIALCEGDDYWTDPYKLQKQVDFLESHPDYSMVYTDFRGVDANNHPIELAEFEHWRNKSRDEVTPIFKRLIQRNFILTLTSCFRREVISSPLYCRCPVPMDYSLFLAAASIGDIKFLDEVTGCYRKHTGGLTSSSSHKVAMGCGKIRKFFLEEFLKDNFSLSSDSLSRALKFEILIAHIRCKIKMPSNLIWKNWKMIKEMYWMLPKLPLRIFQNRHSYKKNGRWLNWF